jgi:hypothetical protein
MKQENRFQPRVFKFLCLGICLLFVLVLGTSSRSQTKTPQMKFNKTDSAENPIIYREYRGVRIGMTMEETRSKLGEPVFKSDDQDVYVFTANETTQVVYNKTRKVTCISTDYLGGVGAPDYRAVVGSELETRRNGSKYKMVRYDNEGFWVSYNQSIGTVPMITVTIQAEIK